jgi:hypothetical protein
MLRPAASEAAILRPSAPTGASVANGRQFYQTFYGRCRSSEANVWIGAGMSGEELLLMAG